MGGIQDWWQNVTSGNYWKQNQQASDQFWNEGAGKGAHDFVFGSQAKAPMQRETDFGQSNEVRAQQMALQAQLAAMAAGNGPSLAQGQLQQATDANIRQAMALGAAQQGQGLGYASALRNIADQSAAARQQAAAQSAMIRNAEQMQAMQAQAGLLGGIRGQDLGQAGMQQQGNQFYDSMQFQQSQANANKGVIPGVLQAGGAILGMGLGQGSQGQQAAPTGFMPGASGPVLDGGLRYGTQSAPGDWTMPDPSGVAHASHGGRVPGYAMGGEMDSRRNDTVPAMLSPGEIVIPRSITMAPDAAERAKLFVQEVQRRRASPPSSDEHPVVRDAMRKRKAA